MAARGSSTPARGSDARGPDADGWYAADTSKGSVHGPAERDGYISVPSGDIPSSSTGSIAGSSSSLKRTHEEAMLQNGATVTEAAEDTRDVFEALTQGTYEDMVMNSQYITDIDSRFRFLRDCVIPRMHFEFKLRFEEEHRESLLISKDYWRADLSQHFPYGAAPSGIMTRELYPPLNRTHRTLPSMHDLLWGKTPFRYPLRVICRYCSRYRLVRIGNCSDILQMFNKCPQCFNNTLVVLCRNDGYYEYCPLFVDPDCAFDEEF